MWLAPVICAFMTAIACLDIVFLIGDAAVKSITALVGAVPDITTLDL